MLKHRREQGGAFKFRKMTHRIVIDADWFVIDKTRYFKKISYCAPTLGFFGVVTYSLPPGSGIHHRDLVLQARHSHGLDWREVGQFRYDEVGKSLERLKERLGTLNVEFYAKGSEKCKLLERHLKSVTDLDGVGCPKYEALSKYRKTTLRKAITFAQWLEWSE